jgi:hypothetical protein
LFAVAVPAEVAFDANWIRVWRPDGIEAYEKDLGIDAGRVRVRSTVRPLQSMVDIAQAQVRAMRDSGAEVEIELLQRLITEEGEWAALARLRVSIDGLRFERTLGIIYGDDFYAQLDGLYLQEHRKRFRLFLRTLLQTYPLRLGSPRRRRYQFTPPMNWQPLAHDLAVRFFPRRFPNEYGCITVLPALPLLQSERSAQSERLLHEDLLTDFTAQQPEQHDRITSNSGMPGELRRRIGLRPGDSRPVHIDIAILRDTRYTYSVRLETRAPNIESHRRLFLQTVRSVTPIPQGASEEAKSGKMGTMWDD